MPHRVRACSRGTPLPPRELPNPHPGSTSIDVTRPKDARPGAGPGFPARRDAVSHSAPGGVRDTRTCKDAGRAETLRPRVPHFTAEVHAKMLTGAGLSWRHPLSFAARRSRPAPGSLSPTRYRTEPRRRFASCVHFTLLSGGRIPGTADGGRPSLLGFVLAAPPPRVSGMIVSSPARWLT